jgi:hypothetical protein
MDGKKVRDIVFLPCISLEGININGRDTGRHRERGREELIKYVEALIAGLGVAHRSRMTDLLFS